MNGLGWAAAAGLGYLIFEAVRFNVRQDRAWNAEILALTAEAQTSGRGLTYGPFSGEREVK